MTTFSKARARTRRTFGKHTVLKGKSAISKEATILINFAYEGEDKPGAGATVTMSVDGTRAEQKKLDATVPGRFGIDRFGVGRDTGQPVTDDYQPPFAFTGEIEKITFEIE